MHRPAAPRARRGGARLLLPRISAQPSAVHLSQAERRVHGRDRDGRRRRHLAARANIGSRPSAPCSPCPRPRSACSPTSAAAGYLSRLLGRIAAVPGADRRAARRRRMLRAGPRHPLCRARAARRAQAPSIARGPRPDRAPARPRPGDAAAGADRGQSRQDRRLFAADTLEGIMAALEADGSELGAEGAGDAARQIARPPARSRSACSARARRMRDFAGEMGMEYALMAACLHHPDFAEGVRALLVDKDNAPRWQPADARGGDRRDARRFVRAFAGRGSLVAAPWCAINDRLLRPSSFPGEGRGPACGRATGPGLRRGRGQGGTRHR